MPLLPLRVGGVLKGFFPRPLEFSIFSASKCLSERGEKARCHLFRGRDFDVSISRVFSPATWLLKATYSSRGNILVFTRTRACIHSHALARERAREYPQQCS